MSGGVTTLFCFFDIALMQQRSRPNRAVSRALRDRMASTGSPEYHICYFASSPLLQRGEMVREMEVLNVDKDRSELVNVLRRSGKAIVMRADVATVGNFRAAITHGTARRGGRGPRRRAAPASRPPVLESRAPDVPPGADRPQARGASTSRGTATQVR